MKLKTKEDLQKELKVSLSKIDKLMKSGELEFLKLGKSVRFTDEHVKNYINNLKVIQDENII